MTGSFWDGKNRNVGSLKNEWCFYMVLAHYVVLNKGLKWAVVVVLFSTVGTMACHFATSHTNIL